jgi:hypothetical protein
METQTQSIPQVPIPRRRHWVLISIGVILLLVVIILFNFLTIMTLLFGKDAPAQSYPDLEINEVRVPEEETAYFDLLNASAITDLYGSDYAVNFQNEGAVWDPVQVSEIWSKNQDLYSILYSAQANLNSRMLIPTTQTI